MSPDAEDETIEPGTESQAMAALREIWRSRGQMQEEFVRLECRPDAEGCSASIGFDGLAETMEPTTDTTDAIARLRAAWKATLAREGKLYDGEPPE